MPTSSSRSLLPPEATVPNVRLRTLVNLRWMALAGQTVTILVAVLALSLELHLGLCFLVIGIAAAANLIAVTIQPGNLRVSEAVAFSALFFDITQLAALLFLTGGLNNPFALFFLAPVTISATTLSLRSTFILAATATVLVSLLGGYHLPLTLSDGTVLALQPLHLAGFWIAIVSGTLFLSGFAFRVTLETERMSNALFATQTALARQQKLQDLGGVVAAAAHELGTPLATIKLVSTELEEELADRPDLRDDAALIRSQADRCRDILRSMGQAGKSDRHMNAVPLEVVVREAAEPHADRGIAIHHDLVIHRDLAPPAGAAGRGPLVRRSPEVIHGLRNLVQNAVDFAETDVWVDVRWSAQEIAVQVIDDGPGYPPEVLSRLGDPFLRSRNRAGYGGMGLGLFIAKTLLERTGATLAFANGSQPGHTPPRQRGGAIAEVIWPADRMIVAGDETVGENQQILS